MSKYPCKNLLACTPYTYLGFRSCFLYVSCSCEMSALISLVRCTCCTSKFKESMSALILSNLSAIACWSARMVSDSSISLTSCSVPDSGMWTKYLQRRMYVNATEKSNSRRNLIPVQMFSSFVMSYTFLFM